MDEEGQGAQDASCAITNVGSGGEWGGCDDLHATTGGDCGIPDGGGHGVYSLLVEEDGDGGEDREGEKETTRSDTRTRHSNVQAAPPLPVIIAAAAAIRWTGGGGGLCFGCVNKASRRAQNNRRAHERGH